MTKPDGAVEFSQRPNPTAQRKERGYRWRRAVWLSNRAPKLSHFHSRRFIMTQELRIDLIIKMSQAIDDLLLSWDAPQPTLNEAIAAQLQSLARAISATTDPGPSLATVKQDLDSIVADILRTYRGKQN